MSNNQVDYSSPELLTYDNFRQNIAVLLDDIDALLRDCTQTMPGYEYKSLEGLSKKLRQNRFNFVLTGGFQSGKSTLFSYLCDGRELSPIGGGGGGIRTSGSRVIAVPIDEGQKEYAVVKWRNQDELLASLGRWLVPFYMEDRKARGKENMSRACVTSDDIDLDNREHRNRLAELAIGQLKERPESSEVLEQIRIALLVSWFYEWFKDKISSPTRETRYDLLEKVVQLSSYPDGWEMRWKRLNENGWKDGFHKEDVEFVFIHSIKYYIDSPRLRQLGSCLIDSPGLSASQWDTDIAEECMREADAVLYLLKGERAVSLDDCKNIRTCTEAGADDYILFGANLRLSKADWKAPKQESESVLQREGYSVPPIYDVHAGIGLRAMELCALESGGLSRASQNAVDKELRQEGVETNDDNRLKFLKLQLDKYLSDLTREPLAKGKSLDDYTEESFGEKNVNYRHLDELSGIPDFVRAASRRILARKKKSLLHQNGSLKALNELRSISKDIERELENLQKTSDSSDNKKTQIDNESQHLGNDIEELSRLAQSFDDDFRKRYNDLLLDGLKRRKDDIIALTADVFVGPWNNIGGWKAPWAAASGKVIANYESRLQDILTEQIRYVCTVMGLSLFRDEKLDDFDKKHKEVCKKYGIDYHSVKSRFHMLEPDKPEVKGWGRPIMEHIRIGNTLAMITSLVGATDYERAKDAVEKNWYVIEQGMEEILRGNVFYRKNEPRGPVQIVRDAYDDIVPHLKQKQRILDSELIRLKNAAEEETNSRNRRIKRVMELAERARLLTARAEQLNREVESYIESE